jgi:hypothetical protein
VRLRFVPDLPDGAALTSSSRQLRVPRHPTVRFCRWVGGYLLKTGLPWQRPGPPGRLTPGSAAGSATSARPCLIWPTRRNPANQGPAARQARRTAGPATRREVGKTVKRDQPEKKTQRQKG